MMYKEMPVDFNKKFDIVGCFVEYDGKFLLLHRLPHKASGDTWGLPAGKVDAGEDIAEAVLREVWEETGLRLSGETVKYFDSFYVRDGDLDIEWFMFSVQLDALPTITIQSQEHSEFRWVTPEEALQMPLIHDQPESIRVFYNK